MSDPQRRFILSITLPEEWTNRDVSKALDDVCQVLWSGDDTEGEVLDQRGTRLGRWKLALGPPEER